IDTELDAIIADVKDKPIETMDVRLLVEEKDPSLEKYVADKLRRGGVMVAPKVSSSGITDPVTVFDDTLQVPWEVDDFWAKFTAEVLPTVKRGSRVSLETRLSESPEVRRTIVDDARGRLTAAGASEATVKVLSAY